MMGSDETRQLESMLMNATNLTGVFYPESRSANGYVIWQASKDILSKPLTERIPPTSLRHWYGYNYDDGKYYDNLYLQGGITDVQSMRKILAQDGFNPMGERIMDFGCSAGRMVRNFEAEARENEVWGVDIHSAAIHWAQTHLSPPFQFFTNTTAPHLPFESNYFGLIYAGSVWTHLGELDDAWFLEMRRVLRPGGRLYITISDQNTLSEIKRIMPNHESNKHVSDLNNATGMLAKDYVMFVTRTTPWQQRAVYKRAELLKRLEQWMAVKIVKESAYGWQTGLLFEKR